MNLEVLIPVISFIFCSGVIYGSLNNRIKVIEKQISESKDIAERLAKIETQIEILITNIKK